MCSYIQISTLTLRVMYDDDVCERFVSFITQSKDGIFISPNIILKKPFIQKQLEYRKSKCCNPNQRKKNLTGNG